MKTFGLLLASLFLFTAVFAQEETAPITDEYNQKNEFGIHAGATTGLGLSYRKWIGKSGFQLTALPIKVDYYTFVSAGATLMHTLKKSKYVRSYLYLGNHFLIQDGQDMEHNIGFGPGFSFGRTVAFNIQSGYGFYDIYGKMNMFPTGEIGLYVKF